MFISFDYFEKGVSGFDNLEGRASRPEFWFFCLYMLLIYFFSFLTTVIILHRGMVLLILTYAIRIPLYSLMVRRIHDVGYSGWFAFPCVLSDIIGLVLERNENLADKIPTEVAGFFLIYHVFLLVLLSLPSEQKNNRYGELVPKAEVADKCSVKSSIKLNLIETLKVAGFITLVDLSFLLCRYR